MSVSPAAIYLLLSFISCNLGFRQESLPPLPENFTKVAALVNFNGDAYTEVFIFNGLALSYLDVNDNSWQYRSLLSNISADRLCVDDFNGDLVLDLAFLRGNSLTGYSLSLHYGKKRHGRTVYPENWVLNLNVVFKTLPLLLDLNSDMLPDFLGTSMLNGSLVAAVSTERQSHFSHQVRPLNEIIADAPYYLELTPNSAFVDLNPSEYDLTADLLLSFVQSTKPTYQPYINKVGVYEKQPAFTIPDEFNAVKVGRPIITGTGGTVQFYFPICHTDNCWNSSLLLYNKSAGSSAGWSVVLDTSQMVTTLGTDLVRFFWPMADASLFPEYDFATAASFSNTEQPDFLSIMTYCTQDGFNLCSSSGRLNDARAVLLQSTSCSEIKANLKQDVSPMKHICSLDSTSTAYYLETPVFSRLPDVVQALPYDPRSRGFLGVLITHGPPRNRQLAFYEQPANGNCFVLIKSLSGADPAICSRDNYITNPPGPTVMYVAPEANGLHRGVATQTSSFLPAVHYSHLGFGSCPNYIDKLFFGVPGGRPVLLKEFSFVIPNSLSLMVPCQPDNPDTWRLITKIHIDLSVLAVVLAVIGGVFVFLLFIVAALHFRDRYLDKKERMVAGQRFFFDAM